MKSAVQTVREFTEESGASATRSELRGQMRIVADDVKKLGEVAKRAASTKLDEMKDRAGRAAGTVRERRDDLEDRATRAIRSRPVTSVLVSAGVGAALASLWGLRRRRENGK